jgi:hypothetical protein
MNEQPSPRRMRIASMTHHNARAGVKSCGTMRGRCSGDAWLAMTNARGMSDVELQPRRGASATCVRCVLSLKQLKA